VTFSPSLNIEHASDSPERSPADSPARTRPELLSAKCDAQLPF
jgi:hypothetical protein